MEERRLLSLSAPASLSSAMEPRLCIRFGSTCPAWDFGVVAPRGLLALEDAADDWRRKLESEAFLNAVAIAPGLEVPGVWKVLRLNRPPDDAMSEVML